MYVYTLYIIHICTCIHTYIQHYIHTISIVIVMLFVLFDLLSLPLFFFVCRFVASACSPYFERFAP